MIDANSPPPMAEMPPTMSTVGLSPSVAEPIEKGKLPISGQWSDQEALSVVRADFQRAETDRSSNHESRWREADETYLAYSRRGNVWEGTRIPRANTQMFTAYENVESLIPQKLDALFGGDLDFDVQPGTAGTTVEQALQVRDLLNYQLKSLGGSATAFVTLRETTRRMTKSSFIYGNGIVEWGWEGPYPTTRTQWTRSQVPEMQQFQHPLVPGVWHRPTGRLVDMVRQEQVQDVVSQYFLKYTDIRDFYIDPNCPSANVQEAGFCAHRKLVTIAEVLSYSGMEGWNVPDEKQLRAFAAEKPISESDSSKSAAEGILGRSFQPGQDQSKDPSLSRLELIRYWQKGRHVWMLNRRHIMRNTGNQYNALPFLCETYTDVLGRFYGLSICDIVRGDQKLMKTLVDGRLDELNLLLHPPTLTKRGSMRSTSMMRFSPGRNLEVDDPQKDVLRLEMGNVTQSAFTEVDSAERRVQKKTGVTDLAVMGVSSSGGNSANRTATGVQAQTNAANSRIHYLVANFEDQIMLPVLTTMLVLTKNFMDPNEILKIVGGNGQAVELDPTHILNADVRFEMKTAQRMKARAGLQGGGMNTLMQYMLNQEVMSLMGEQQGKTLDMESLMALYCDTYNLRSTSFWRPMSPQEQQAQQQLQHGPAQAKMQLQQARIQQMSADAHERDETTLIVALIKGLADAGMLHMVQGIEAPVQLEARRLDADIAAQQAQPAAA